MYRLEVFNPAHPERPLVIRAKSAAHVADLMPRLVDEHPECERIDVYGDQGRLFSVDCGAVAAAASHKDLALFLDLSPTY